MTSPGGDTEVLREPTPLRDMAYRLACNAVAFARRLCNSYSTEAAVRGVADAARRNEDATNAFLRSTAALTRSADQAADLLRKRGR